MDPDSMKVSELRAELGRRDLDSKGLKAALVERLKLAIEKRAADAAARRRKANTAVIACESQPVRYREGNALFVYVQRYYYRCVNTEIAISRNHTKKRHVRTLAAASSLYIYNDTWANPENFFNSAVEGRYFFLSLVIRLTSSRKAPENK